MQHSVPLFTQYNMISRFSCLIVFRRDRQVKSEWKRSWSVFDNASDSGVQKLSRR